GALPLSGENSDIFVLIPNTPATLFGRDSAVLRNGTAMNGDKVFPTTRIAVAPRANGRRTISSGAAVGSGSFHCKEAMSAPVSFTTAVFSSSRKDRVSVNDCTPTSSATRLAAKFLAQPA